MGRPARAGLVVLLAGSTLTSVLVFNGVMHGLSARDEPTAAEAFVARYLQSLAISRAQRAKPNPLPLTGALLARAREHFAEHCASCHGNDGRGQTALGSNLKPRAPDMRLPETQQLSDGELFALIENGVRSTGMPAWGEAGPADDDETWELVHFIRHLPKLTADELEQMEQWNPRSRRELQQEEEGRRFLEGRGDPSGANAHERGGAP
jgi:mono/diheme cytochrome c family protein